MDENRLTDMISRLLTGQSTKERFTQEVDALNPAVNRQDFFGIEMITSDHEIVGDRLLRVANNDYGAPTYDILYDCAADMYNKAFEVYRAIGKVDQADECAKKAGVALLDTKAVRAVLERLANR